MRKKVVQFSSGSWRLSSFCPQNKTKMSWKGFFLVIFHLLGAAQFLIPACYNTADKWPEELQKFNFGGKFIYLTAFNLVSSRTSSTSFQWSSFACRWSKEPSTSSHLWMISSVQINQTWLALQWSDAFAIISSPRLHSPWLWVLVSCSGLYKHLTDSWLHPNQSTQSCRCGSIKLFIQAWLCGFWLNSSSHIIDIKICSSSFLASLSSQWAT